MESPYSDRQYVNDSVLLDGLYEFHSDYFKMLEPEEWHDLQTYYLTGQKNIPADVIEYRRACSSDDPDVEARARQVIRKLRRLSDMPSDD
jgi:hypothetical protein